MEFGLMMPALTGWQRSPEDANGGYAERYEAAHEICALVERLGFDFVTIGQHRFTPKGVDSAAPLTVLPALMARTTTLRFVTNIVILGTHHPVDVAEQTATIDEMSGGRLVLGVGLGYRPYEFDALGLDYKKRVGLMEEAIEVVRRCWAEEPATFHGNHFTVNSADVSPKPIRPGGPPIWIGAQVEPAIMRAARVADGWLADNVQASSAMEPIVARYRAEAAKHGRPATVAINRKVACAPTRQEVDEKWLTPILDFFRAFPALGAVFEDKAFMEKLVSGNPMTLDDVPDDQMIAGTPEDCIASIKTLQQHTRPEAIVCDFGDGARGEKLQDLKNAITLFAEKVMPAFR